MAQLTGLYTQTVAVTHRYLGDVAEDFVNRQIEHHLHKSPNDLTPADLSKLIDWIRVTVSLIIDERDVIEDYLAQLQRLIQTHPLQLSEETTSEF